MHAEAAELLRPPNDQAGATDRGPRHSKSIFLTEKETNLIIYLDKSKQPVNVDELQSEVWGYKNQIETHTVETHIHRLRKKILNELNKDNFILSNKIGYYLSK